MARTREILVWDIPTRLSHWLLAACFAGAYAVRGAGPWSGTHVLIGCTVAGLIVFRLLWGLIGTRYARFASFPLQPGDLRGYLRSLRSKSPEHHAGHSPAGGWAALVMLALIGAVAASGWACFKGVGPVWMAPLHGLLANVAVALIGAHVAAVIISSRLHHENLIRAMLTGFKRGAAWDGQAEATGWVTGAMLIAAVAALWICWTPDLPDRPPVENDALNAAGAAHAPAN